MSKLTGNNKDLLFKTSTFLKWIVLEEDVSALSIKKAISNFTDELIDDGVINEESVTPLRESLLGIFMVMFDNRNEGMYGQYFDEDN